jgi:hypothetical protein
MHKGKGLFLIKNITSLARGMDIFTTSVFFKQEPWWTSQLEHIFHEHDRIQKDMLMNQCMGGEKLFSRCFPVHSNAKAGTMEVPRILPSLCPVEEGIGMITSFSMDHEEVLIICPMGILDDSLEMTLSGRNRIQESIEAGKSAIPLSKLLFAATEKL